MVLRHNLKTSTQRKLCFILKLNIAFPSFYIFISGEPSQSILSSSSSNPVTINNDERPPPTPEKEKGKEEGRRDSQQSPPPHPPAAPAADVSVSSPAAAASSPPLFDQPRDSLEQEQSDLGITELTRYLPNCENNMDVSLSDINLENSDNYDPEKKNDVEDEDDDSVFY